MESLRARYETEMAVYQQHATEEEEPATHLTGTTEDAHNAALDDGATNTEEQARANDNADAPHQRRPSQDEERKRVRSREPSQSRGAVGGYHGMQGKGLRRCSCSCAQSSNQFHVLLLVCPADGYRESKRSRIPFDVTKMSYDQYCAKYATPCLLFSAL